ncbi:cytochrome b/b6 domain-containing protein [Insolitispirillum peregrinum]|uniref:cytochrome b/b6 domain-containing protein n=1 Tax=Insolitispirillum peregrinum TaxID=80876 RepID=UPI00361F0CBE
MPPSRFPVPPWSITVRVLHWGLVCCCFAAWGTAWLGPPSALVIHVWVGSCAGFILLVRLLWGLGGPWWERFAFFPLRKDTLRLHTRQILARQHPPEGHAWPGHPPLGAAMVVALLVLILTMVLSGTIAYGGTEKAGPLGSWVPFPIGELAGTLHATLAIILLLAVGGHLLGVIIESRLLGSALVRAMFIGHRDGSHTPPAVIPASLPPLRLWGGASLIAILIGLSALLISGHGPLHPLPLWQTEEDANATTVYEQECGACHMAYPPALLPASSWSEVLATLDDHFGEDASLPAAKVSALQGWLPRHAAESWDNKAGHAFRRVDDRTPTRITATPFWQDHHRQIPIETFGQKNIGSRGNCRACHQDVQSPADSDGFHRAEIAIPPR